MKILFWNLRKQEEAAQISRFLSDRSCDIAIFSECPDKGNEFSGRFAPEFIPVRRYNSRVLCLFRHETTQLNPISEFEKYSFWSVRIGSQEFTLAGVHLSSGLHMSLESRNDLAKKRLRRDIDNVEARVKHDRTIVIGDFNLNPYDTAIVSSEGMHAISSLRESRKLSRTVDQEKSKFFYNPMWSYLGDRSKGPPGTYFWKTSEAIGFGWNMIDQVIFRPSVLEAFRDFDVDILSAVGENSLLNKNERPKGEFSDHLPLWIEFRP